MLKSKTMNRLAHLRGASLLALSVAGCLTAVPAFAQEAEVVEEVVITGSRTIRDGAQAPTPVTVANIDQLTQASPRNLTESLTQLPAFRGSRSTNTTSSSASNNGAGSFVDLRGLGPERTLVLLDGRRVAPGTTGGVTNFDLLPQPLVQRVEVVTGGASAAYGSDAVAGVVNVILDRNFSGIKGLVQGGISDKGDVGAYKFEISAGGRYLDDKLHVIASYGNRRSNPLMETMQRDWGRRLPGEIASTNPTIASNLVFDYRQRNYTGGYINSATANNNIAGLANLKFLPGGVVSAHNIGTINNAAAQVGGDGTSNYITLASLVEGETAFARATYDVTDTLNFYVQGSFSEIHNQYEVTAHSVAATSAFTIFEDNVFLPAYVRTTLQAIPNNTADTTNQAYLRNCLTLAGYATTAPIGPNYVGNRCFRLSRFNLDLGRLIGDIQSSSTDFVTGFESEIFGGYRFSGYWEHGQNKARTLNINNIWFEHIHAAMDAVANPAVGGVPGVAAGAPVCRARLQGTPTAPNPTGYADCAPMNPFGFGSPSEAAKNYVYGTGFFGNKARQDVWALDFAGEPFELPAGPLSVAIGAEYRQLFISQYSGAPEQNPGKFTGAMQGVRGAPPSQIGVPGSFGFSNLLPFSGSYDVQEAYLEVDIPLLKDLPLAQELSVNAAARHTEYSTTGPVETWKVGASWRPLDDVRFRGTVSRDIRAPNPQELFATGSRFERTFNDPFDGGRQVTAFDVTIGNPNLLPEEADTLTAGIVFTPTWIPGLTVALDYFDIEINGAITAVGTQDTLNRCFQGSQALCDNITRVPDPAFPAGRIILVENSPQNFNQVVASGVDLEVGYMFQELPVIPGTLRLRSLFSYTLSDASAAPGDDLLSTRGETGVGDSPYFRGVLQFTYENGPVTWYTQFNYISSGLYDPTFTEGLNPTVGTVVTATGVSDNEMPSSTTIDMTFRYKFGEDRQYETFLTVNNVLDKDPPVYGGGSATTTFATNNTLYETLGRYYTAGLRFKF